MDERDIISLELDRDTASDIIDLLRTKRDVLNQEIAQRQAELDALIGKATHLGFQLEKITGKPITAQQTPVSVVGKQPRAAVKPINGYKVNFTVWEKVQYVLRKQIEPIPKRQIIERIEEFDPAVAALAGKKRRQFSVSVSNILTTKSGKGLVKFAEEGKENKYQLPNLENIME
jgi:hypothetical protein